MKTSRMILPLVSSLAIAMLGSMPTLAEIPPLAGTVTHVFGTATLQHGPDGEALPLHFKDKVYLQDKITTDEDSVVRVLMGNKALVTVSEMSVMTITKEVNHATLDVESGAISLSVARKRMNPGEYIEIRTPHAVAAIKGTKLVAEVASNHSSRFSVIEGEVWEAHHKSDPTNRFPIVQNQRFEFNKPQFGKPGVQRLPREPRASLVAKLGSKTYQPQEDVNSLAESNVADMQMTKALELANQMAPVDPVVDMPLQVASAGNSNSSTTTSSSTTQSSTSEEVVAMNSPSSGTSDSSSSVTQVVSAPSPVPVSAPAPVPVSAPAPVAVSAPAPVAVSAPAPVAVSAPAPVAVKAPAPVAVKAPAPVAVKAPAPVAVKAPAPISRWAKGNSFHDQKRNSGHRGGNSGKGNDD